MIVPKSNCIPSGEARGPGPLKVESAEVSGDVDDFADEIKSRHSLTFHGLGGKLVSVDAAGGDFRFDESFRA